VREGRGEQRWLVQIHGLALANAAGYCGIVKQEDIIVNN
jgi:hypothetical protein